MSDKSKSIEFLLEAGASGELTEEMIDSLEARIIDCNKAMSAGKELVDDSTYDALWGLLESVAPSSPVLQEIWSEEGVDLDKELDYFLQMYPMKSIRTIKSIDKLDSFKSFIQDSGVSVLVSTKLNGHGIRVVYKDGVLVKASSRARASAGRDITSQLRLILGESNNALRGLGLVEIRGEVVLPFSRLAEARVYNPTIKSAFSGVASMLRDSASEPETRLLEFVAYDVMLDGSNFQTLESKFDFLFERGFIIPLYRKYVLRRVGFEGQIKDILAGMDVSTENYDYFLDGLVVAVDDIKQFNSFGEGNRDRGGNFALKMGKWKQDGYSGVIERIDWRHGKTKITPVAVLEGEGVLTASGNYVKNVPLFSPRHIYELEAYVGSVLFFKYGGESGVYPCFPDGTAVDLAGGID